MDNIIELAKKKGILRALDLNKAKIPRQYLTIACERGLLKRIGRGLYCIPNTMTNEHRTLAEVCKRVPSAVICLLSALQFHNLTTQLPHKVWIAIDEKQRKPKLDFVQLRIARFSGPALKEGVAKHSIEGVEIRVYNPPKTVADCFKYRNKIGVDIAIEALRDCLRKKKATVDELVKYSRTCRVERVMAPYIEALL